MSPSDAERAAGAAPRDPGQAAVPESREAAQECRQASADVQGGANAQWGGRFAGGPSAVMAEINASVGFDRAL